MKRLTLPQGERLINFLRKRGKRGATYLELSLLCVSTSPWRRLSSDEHPERWLKKGEQLTRKLGADKLVRFYVVAA